MVGFGRCDPRRVKHRQHAELDGFASSCAHRRHIKVGALEKRMQITAFEDNSVDTEDERKGNEEKCCHGGQTEEHS